MQSVSRVLLTAVLVLLPSISRSQDWLINVGPKIGYTVGPDGGFTFGAEVSVINYRSGSPSGTRYGYTFEVTGWEHHTSFHAGVEGFLPGCGLDIGPTLLVTLAGGKSSTTLGVSAIPFVGALLLPYAELLFTTGNPMFYSYGAFVKFPVNLHFDGFG